MREYKIAPLKAFTRLSQIRDLIQSSQSLEGSSSAVDVSCVLTVREEVR